MSESPPVQINLPFHHNPDVHAELKADMQKIKINGEYIQPSEIVKKLNIVCTWLCTTPKTTTLRVNSFNTTTKFACQLIRNLVKQDSKPFPVLMVRSDLPELITVHSWDDSVNLDLNKCSNEVIVDTVCGAAVLRGAHVFSPGVKGIPRGVAVGDKVSVFADIVGRCKKGFVKKYEDDCKVFLGNGIVKKTREYLFGKDANNVSGIAVHMTDVISRVPPISDPSSLVGYAMLQNLPSIICTRVLNPQPGETVLDMCAAPGNKTTHISYLMKGEGIVVALERNKHKLKLLENTCKEFSSDNVRIFECDSTKAVSNEVYNVDLNDGPPYKENIFDRVLLDTPCSALGQRPQILNQMKVSQLRSYIPQQRKLFSAGVRLLKPNGILVYSTCTITIAENEGIVAWALKNFPNLKLKSVKELFPMKEFGTPGYSIDGLSEEQADCVRRFGPESDTIGFFIACFIKVDEGS